MISDRVVRQQNRSPLALMVLGLGLLLTTLTALFAFRAFDAAENQRFNEASDEIQIKIQARLDFFKEFVRQIASAYSINPDLTQDQFNDYVYSTGIRARDSGVTAYGIFKRLPSQKGGPEKFIVWHRKIVDSPKNSSLASIGTVVSTEAERMDLFRRAIDSGDVAIADHIKSFNPGMPTGQMMAIASYRDHLPISVEERRRSVIGIAYARFNKSGLFDQAFRETGPYKAGLKIEIFEGGPSEIETAPKLFVQHPEIAIAAPLARVAVSKVKAGSREFTLRVISDRPFFSSWATLIASLIIAIGVAVSLLSFRFLAQREQRTYRLQILEDISQVLTTSLDTPVIAANLTHKLLIFCDWCVIKLIDEKGQLTQHHYAAASPVRTAALHDFYRDFPADKFENKLTERARETKRTQHIERSSNDDLKTIVTDGQRLERLHKIGFESIIVAPLLRGDGVIGSIAIYSGDSTRRYSATDIQLIEEIATRASHAFENSRLYTESQNLNHAKDHFLAMLSHELRTPMNVILGWLEILSTETVDSETYKQALDTLNRNANMQIQLINDLLDVSRIINGKLSLHAVPSRLGAIVSGAIDSIQPAVRGKKIECTLKTEGNLDCTVDPERLQQVLWNLLSNAVKFTPIGGKIAVSVLGSENEVQIDIKDSGSGIEQAFLPHVFDRFRQEEAGFTRSQGGLGLGLSIVRYITEGHGGTVSVTSGGRGKGAVFTVKLPRVAQIRDDASHLAALL